MPVLTGNHVSQHWISSYYACSCFKDYIILRALSRAGLPANFFNKWVTCGHRHHHPWQLPGLSVWQTQQETLQTSFRSFKMKTEGESQILTSTGEGLDSHWSTLDHKSWWKYEHPCITDFWCYQFLHYSGLWDLKLQVHIYWWSSSSVETSFWTLLILLKKSK